MLDAFDKSFRAHKKPFFLVFWSRDPDGTQHNQRDGSGRIQVGIGGPTSRAAVDNADGALQRILDFLDVHDPT